MAKKNKFTEEERLRFFLEKEEYTSLINHYGVNELVKFVEMELLIPLKAELHKKNSIIKMCLESLNTINE